MEINELSQRLKQCRVACGLSQADLAEKLNLTPQTISKWERGLSLPDIYKISDLCSVFGVSVGALLDNVINTDKNYLIAIDGGGTKTEFVLYTEDGQVVARQLLSGTNPNVCGIENSCKTLKSGIDALLCEGGHVNFIYAGIAGAYSGKNKAKLQAFLKKQYPLYKIRVESDVMNVVGLSEDGGKCTACIVGTGSCVYGYDGKELHRAGGWGYLFDLEGSGYYIGRELITQAFASCDGLQPETLSTKLVMEKLGGKPIECIETLYGSGSDYIASFAPIAFTAMEQGDKTAEKIVKDSAKRIAQLIKFVQSKYSVGNRVIMSGSICKNQKSFQDCVCEYLGKGVIVEYPNFPQILGGMRKGMDYLELKYSKKEFVKNFIESYKN